MEAGFELKELETGKIEIEDLEIQLKSAGNRQIRGQGPREASPNELITDENPAQGADKFGYFGRKLDPSRPSRPTKEDIDRDGHFLILNRNRIFSGTLGFAMLQNWRTVT